MKKRTLKSALALALAFTMLYRMLPAAFAVEQSQLPTPEGGMMDEAALEGDSLNSFAPESGSQLEANPNTQSGQPSEEPAAGQPETGDPVSEKNSVGEPSEDPAETEQPIRNFCTVRGYVRLSDEDASLSEDKISDLLDAEGTNLKEYSNAEILQKQQELQTIRAQALGMSISDFEQAAALHRSVGAYQQELTAFEISRSHAQLSEEDGETILQLINGGYSNSQAFAANIAAGELGLSIQQLLDYKAAELAKTQNELAEDEPFALFSNPEENIQVTEEIQNPEYIKIATKLGVPYQAIEGCTAQKKAKLPQITQAFDAKLEARYPNQAAAWTEDAEESNSNLAGNSKVHDSSSVQTTSSGDIDFAPQKILDKPFSYDKIADASVNLSSGEFSYQETDLSIPGVNGLDLNFTRRYRSDDSQAIQPWATIDDSGSGKAFSVGLKPYLCTRRGKIIEEIFDINDYVSYDGDSFADVFAQEYQDGYWEFPLSQSGNVFVYNFSAGEYYEAAYFKSTLEPSIYLAFDKTGSEVCVGFHPILIGISPKFENYCENSNRMADIYNKNEYGFGNGWRLGFSSIESFSVSNYYYVEEKQRLITSDGMQYIIHFTPDSTDSNLEGYKLSDIRLEQTGNGYPGASYTLFHADGKKEYFDANGRNIAIVDRYGNAITLSYTVALDTVSKITIVDTLGHVIIYKNENIDRSVKWKENSVTYNEKWTLSLDGTVVQTYYSYNYTTSSDLDICTLAMVKNEGGEYTKYSQYSGTYKFNCFVSSPSTNDGINSYVTLSTIIFPNQEKISMLQGESPKRTLGFSGYETYYCVHSLRLEAKGTSRTEYNQYTTYQYSDYTHLYAEPGKALQYSSDDYSTTVTHERLKWMDMLTAWRQTESVFTFSPEHLKLEEKQYHSEPLQDDLLNTSDDIDTSRKLVKKYVYTYNNRDLPASITETNYSSTGEPGMTTALSYTYDSKGNILTQTVPDNNGGTYTTAYTYDAEYNLPLTASYSQDAFKTIRIQNTLTADKKGIATTVTTENSAQKARADYTYNDKGQVTEEKDYIDITNFAEKQFVYGTSEAPQAQVTERKTVEVRDADGALVDGTDGYPAGILVHKTEYDIRGRVTKQIDANGNETSIVYEPSGRISSVTNPDGSSNTYTYEMPKREHDTVIHTNELGTPIKYTYDKFGNELSAYDMIRGQMLYSKRYDSVNHLIEEIHYSSSGDNTVTYYYYDSADRLIEKGTKNAAGALTSKVTYDYTYAGGLLKTTKTVSGDANAPSIVTTSYTNNMGNIVKTGRILNGTEYYDTYTYDYVGNKLSEKTAQTYANTPNAEYTTKWEYNYAGLVTKTINALGDFTTSSYDGLQRFISAADYVSNSQTTPYYTTYMYDAVGRILKESIPFHQDGSMMEYSVKTYGYDANGNVTASKITTNKPGEAETKSVTTYSYNNRDQMIRTQTGSDFTTYTYDAAGNPLTVTTANGEAVTGYAYDHLGNLTTMTDAMGQKETHTYDLNGNLLTTTDRNGNVTTFTYDDLGRQVNVQVKSAAGTLLSSKQTAYTLTGQTLSEQNDTATVTWKYDALGRMTQESETGGVVKNYTYNLADLRTGYQLLVGGAQKMNTTYTYDQMNRLSTVLENGAQAASYTYDKNGNRATMTNGNGTTVTYAYNAANLVTSLQNKKGLSTLSNYVYQYYLDGNQAQKNDHTGRSTSYAYDAQRRLTQEAESGAADAVTKAYRFDEAGNRLSMTVTGAESYTTNYTYDRNNRLLTETRTSGGTQQVTDYTYDANGNTQTKTTGASSEQYTYDGFNRLVKVVNAAGTTTYDYRPDGLRNSKTVAGVKTAHIWDGQNMSAELNASGAILRAYIRGVGLIAEDDAAGTRQYALYNAHGDVVQLSNTNGVVTREYQYDAFGNERNPDAADANPFRYCGEYFDAETGDIYLRARYYDPAIGRFTQMDTHWNPGNMIYGDNPIKVNPNQDILGLNTYTYIADITAIMQSGNKYVYCMDDPMNCFDPSGDAGQTVSIGSGWYCRIDPEIEGVNQRHIHIWNDRKRFAQNIDGSPHDKDKNDRGNPPKWVRKAIKDSKKLGNWDWDAQHKKFFNDAEISLSDGPMYYKYPNGTIIYIPYSYCLSAEDAYYSKNLTIDPENPKVFYIFNVSPITVPMPNFNPLPVVI